jgi:uncharacterized membrane protein
MADSDNLLFQNIDIPSNNPLNIKDAPKKPAFTKKKIIIISGFSLLFVLLITVAILESNLIHKDSNTVSTELTPTPEINQNVVPELEKKLNEVDGYVIDNRRLLPPEIDLKLGL